MALFSSLPGKGIPLGIPGEFLTVITRGLPARPRPAPPEPNLTEQATRVQDLGGRAPNALTTSLASVYPSVLRDTSGRVIVPTGKGYVDLGQGRTLEFDDHMAQGRITPSLSGQMLSDMSLYWGEAPISFSGSDVRILLEVADPPQEGDSMPRVSKQLLECTTLSISVHRVKTPVAAAGFYNPKGFARGRRTIAGSLILTQFTTDVFLRFLQTVVVKEDSSKDFYYSKPDQIPSFNMSLLFTNEQGFASYRRLLGVELVTDGITYSSNDMFSEQMISYYAADVTPLLPLTMTSLWANPLNDDRRRKREATVQDVMDRTRTLPSF